MFDGQSRTVHHEHEASLSEGSPSHEAQVLDHGAHGYMNDPIGHIGHAAVHEAHDSAMSHHGHDQSSMKDHGGEGGHSMAMFFHAGDTETILFNFWRTESALAIGLSCVLIFLVAVLYEGLKFYREWLFERKKRRLEGGRDQHGPPRRYGEQNYNYNPPTYPYRQPLQQQTQGQAQIYAYRLGPPPPIQPPPIQSPPIQPGDVTGAPSAQPSQIMPRQAPQGTGRHHIQQPSPEAEKVSWRRRLCSPMHLYQTFLHVLQVLISFLLMLVFMTFNVWLCLAVLLGAGVGYFVFCAFSTRINEHCN